MLRCPFYPSIFVAVRLLPCYIPSGCALVARDELEKETRPVCSAWIWGLVRDSIKFLSSPS